MSSELVPLQDTAIAPMEDAPDGRALAAPVGSFVRFNSTVNQLKESGQIPAQFDRYYFGNQSGSITAQVRGALKFFGLVDEQYRPTGQLRELAVADDDERRRIYGELVRAKYADALALGENSTFGQLADVFRQRGLTGATIEKAITFFLAMCEAAGIEVSPFFKQRAKIASSPARRRAKRAPTPVAPAPTPVAPPAPQPVDQKAAYVDLLMKLVQDGAAGEAGVQTDLLDRLERAIGVPPVADPTKGDQEPPA
jgi:hypothetical protein